MYMLFEQPDLPRWNTLRGLHISHNGLAKGLLSLITSLCNVLDLNGGNKDRVVPEYALP